MYKGKINIKYDLFQEEDFEEYENKITELLLENREQLEEEPCDVLYWLNEELYFCDNLAINICDEDDVLYGSDHDRIYDSICDQQRNSLDNFLVPLTKLIKKIKMNIPKMIENE